ncbi:MAG: hypothetical protein NT159_16925 [Proteobacteria bacterium]|nr:hypothetical protein [Pseudomonadota bacterium]
MAGRLNSIFSPLVAATLSVGGIGLAYGQKGASLPDPTRPPVTATEVVSPGAENVPPPSGLQTVILGRGHKPMAVINGIMVELGDKIGDATLVKLTESEAVLQGPAGKEVLRLLPGVVKKTESSGLKKEDGKNHDE